jgi:hypothetical protein
MNAHIQLPAMRTNIVDICKARSRALDLMTEAADRIAEAQDLIAEAHNASKIATMGRRADPPQGTKAAEALSVSIEKDAALVAYRKRLDADIWTHLLSTTGMTDLMDKTAKDELRKNMLGEVPEATEENITATLETLVRDSGMTFQRGLAKAFTQLDKRFKSHDGFKLGARIIIDNLFDRFGGWNGYYGKDDTLADVERVFAVLDGEKPSFNSLRQAISASRPGFGVQQSETEAAYFKVRGFKNGNAHLWFTRDDLVTKANKLLREYYGEVLPDAATVNEKPTGTAVSTKLQFYGTPLAAAEQLVRNLNFKPGAKVLEPQAGEGGLLRVIPKHCQVTAIEVHPQRAAYIGAICANFLTYELPPVFDFVLMNPPFFGTHWMDHVRKAYEALAPGGILRSILPASAEVNESTKHEAFRAWVQKNSPKYHRPWTDLPPESFAASGTNVQTVILEMRKDRSAV